MCEQLTPGVASFFILFFAFAIVHAVGDFALQSNFVSRSKVPRADLSDFFGSHSAPPHLWIHSLTAHALIHGGGVWLVSGSPIFGIVEFVVHWVIDLLKGLGLIGFHFDQILHLLCKLIYAALIALFWL